MTALVVYDSAYGNTHRIAEDIARGIGDGVPARRLGEACPEALAGVDLLVVGSPTQGGRATAATQAWLGRLPALSGARIAAFDTRIAAAEQGFALRALMGIIGYAAPRIHKALVAAGGKSAAAPEGFIVGGKEGPLREGESERAAAWGRALAGR